MQVNLNFLSFLASIVSIILGIIAVLISLYFYNQAKKTEKETAVTLEAIKAQTETLQKITARQLNKFINKATNEQPMHETFIQIFTAIKQLQQEPQPLPVHATEIETLTAQAIEGYIGSIYYACIANALAQAHLPPLDNFNPDNDFDSMLQVIIDTSLADIKNVTTLLDKVHSTRIESSAVYSYYKTMKDIFPLVKSTADRFKELQKESE